MQEQIKRATIVKSLEEKKSIYVTIHRDSSRLLLTLRSDVDFQITPIYDDYAYNWFYDEIFYIGNNYTLDALLNVVFAEGNKVYEGINTNGN